MILIIEQGVQSFILYLQNSGQLHINSTYQHCPVDIFAYKTHYQFQYCLSEMIFLTTSTLRSVTPLRYLNSLHQKILRNCCSYFKDNDCALCYLFSKVIGGKVRRDEHDGMIRFVMIQNVWKLSSHECLHCN
jgi:hypothetical protein